MKKRILPLIVICSLIPAIALASTMLALDLNELTRAADDVVVSEVVGFQAEPSRGGIITRVLIRVEAQITGDVSEGDELEVIIPGGEFNGVGMLVHGAPQLVPGERYLLFLRRQSPNYRVVGSAQGAFPIQRDTNSGQLIVAQPTNLPGLVRRQHNRLQPAQPAIVNPTPLDDVIARVLEAHHGH